MLQLTNMEGNKVWVRTGDIMAVERYEAPTTSIQLPGGANIAKTRVYFRHGNAITVVDLPEAILEAIRDDEMAKFGVTTLAEGVRVVDVAG